jgi:phosphoribosylaminoimidazole (AIR) synthetase
MAMRGQKNGLTYADAGVDIDAGNLMVEKIKPPTARSAASAGYSTSWRRALPIRCWWPPTTASAPS